MSSIDPRSLRTYLAVCRERSISGAARRLNISQPAVSVTIAQLEQTVGATLFERSRSGIILSAAGSALLRQAEALEVLLRNAQEDVEVARERVLGPLRIGGTPGALVSLVPAALNCMMANGARYAVQIMERSDADCLELLRRGEIEIAVVTVGIELPPADIEEIAVTRDRFSLIAGGRENRLPPRLRLSETRDLRWVMPAAAGAFRRQVDALFLASAVPLPPDVIRCDSLLTTKAIVGGGTHVTILPDDVVAAECASGTLRAIELIDAPVDRQIGIRRLAGGPQSVAAGALVAAMHTQA